MSKRLAAKSASVFETYHAPGRAKSYSYEAFDVIDGRHPWQTAVPEGYVAYPVRRLNRGRVAYFNFALAREMGLIPQQHPDTLTPELTQKILDTFSIQIINEYDQQNGSRIKPELIKPHPYMATRYLQLQHSNKQGKTSGDGRSIWNGTVQHKGTTWDISSRGTGVTCLSPGAAQADRPLKTGASEFGYGCGQADVTELLGSAVMSEIFHLNGIETERALTIIDLGKGCGIGVRAAPNLIRPAHLFLYLKQGKLEPLRQAADYLIDRQFQNGKWAFSSKTQNRYRLMLRELSVSFARFAARLERQYIFAWMDWDGDNILASAGIIDYGSIRQFGLRHDQYRYDDVERFSTNLNEQRGKARQMIQVFAQLVSFLESGKRRPFGAFAKHKALKEFDRSFDLELRSVFLAQVGFSEIQVAHLLQKEKKRVDRFYDAFLALEKTKTKTGTQKLPDGLNRPAVFNMRAALRELPSLFLGKSQGDHQGHLPQPIAADEFVELIASGNAKRADRKLKSHLRGKIARFQNEYISTLGVFTQNLSWGSDSALSFEDVLKSISERSQEQNRSGRITGNASEFIVDALLRARRRGLSVEEVQAALDLFIAGQVPKAALSRRKARLANLHSKPGRLYQQLLNIAYDFQEDI